jgi:hypothetical protein
MKRILAGLLLAFSVIAFQTPGAIAKESAKHQSVQIQEPNESDLQEHGHYVNKSGKTVHSPAHSKSDAVPPGATAQCGDGSYSFSQSHRGTCSHHGGVAQWL